MPRFYISIVVRAVHLNGRTLPCSSSRRECWKAGSSISFSAWSSGKYCSLPMSSLAPTPQKTPLQAHFGGNLGQASNRFRRPKKKKKGENDVMSGARRAFSSPPVPVSLARTRRDAQKKKGLQCCCIYPIQENRHRVYPNRVCPSPLWADSLPWSSPLTDPSGDESDASRLDGGGTKGAGLTGRTVRRAESWKQMTAVPWPYKLHSFLVGNFFFFRVFKVAAR